MLALAQDQTEAVMASVLSDLGGRIQYGLAVVDLTSQADRAVVKFNDGSERMFDHVIGADGFRSTVREQAGIEFPGIDLDQVWSIADVDFEDWLHPSKLTVVQAEPGTVMVVAPMGGTRYRVVASHDNALSALPIPVNVINVRREGTFKISVRQARTYSKGRIQLAGDAAHCHSPVGGRGMNLGIGDACDLASRMIDGALDGYAENRHPLGASAIAVTERGRKMVSGLTWQRRFAFRALLRTVDLVPAVQRRLGRFLVEF